jgi:OOP family OmpA-OmpF porin
MNSKKQLLFAAGLAACCTTVLATELDDRWYLSAGVGYALPDSKRDLGLPGLDIDGGPAAYVGIGKAINDWLNIELNVKGNQYDIDGSGDGHWKQYGATLDGLVFFNRDLKWAPYAVVGAGEMHSKLPGDSFNTPVVEAGLGLMHVVNDSGDALRAEVRHRWDFTDGKHLLGQDKTFNDWVFTVGVTIPIGKRPAAPAPVAVAVAEPAPLPPPPPPAPVTETVVLKGVNFCFNCDKLSGEAKAILDGNAMALVKDHPNATFEVAGHTDSKGSDSYNKSLSQRRANNVRAYLVEQGVDGSRMTATGYGESQPVADNATEAGRAQNRRVELRVTE